MGTVQPIEVLWLLAAGIGIGFSISNLFDSLADLRAVGQLTNGNQAVVAEVARLSVWNEVVRLILFAYLLLIGVVAAFTPEATTPTEHPLTVALISGLLILLAVTLVAKTAMNYYGRRRIMALLRKQEHDDQDAAEAGGRRRGDDATHGEGGEI